VEPGRTTAQDLQVHLIGCEPPAHLGGTIEIEQPEYLIPLRWSFGHKTSIDLPAGGSRFVDLLEVRHNAPAWAILTTVPAPPEGQFLRAEQDVLYAIRIRIVGGEYYADNLSRKRAS
jgi:hypothetical protein